MFFFFIIGQYSFKELLKRETLKIKKGEEHQIQGNTGGSRLIPKQAEMSLTLRKGKR